MTLARETGRSASVPGENSLLGRRRAQYSALGWVSGLGSAREPEAVHVRRPHPSSGTPAATGTRSDLAGRSGAGPARLSRIAGAKLMRAAPTLTRSQEATASWAVSLLHAVARDEAAGRRPPRLAEPRLNTWARSRGLVATTMVPRRTTTHEPKAYRVAHEQRPSGGPSRVVRTTHRSTQRSTGSPAVQARTG